jgi:hypothetical protein
MSQDGRRTPLWQQCVNGVDRIIAPPLEAVFRHEAFGLAVALSKRAGSDFKARSERLSRRGLHALNIPAASDINQLLDEIAYVERQLRVLTKAVDDAGRPTRRAGAGTPTRGRRDPAVTTSPPGADPVTEATAPTGSAHEKG